jgi:hypothetical protein
MINTFRNYLKEAKSTAPLSDGPLTHLYHTSSLGHMAGEDGASHAIGSLNTLFSHLVKGKLPKDLKVKVDGSPSVVMSGPSAKYPNGTVATKSAFNVNPKINASHEDIDTNHGDKLGLADKLKDLHDSVSKIIPPGMTVQGDLMHSGDKDVREELIDGRPHLTFKSNLIRYAVPSDSEEADKIRNSKIGVALHTMYDEHGRAKPISETDMAKLGQHPDVHVMSVIPTNPPAMDKDTAAKINQHLTKATVHHDALTRPDDSGTTGYDAIHPHGLSMETYVNHTIRENKPQSVSGYTQWLADRGEKEAMKMKTAGSQAKKRADAQEKIAHVKKNKAHFDNAFGLQSELEKATSHMSDAMAQTHGYRSFIGDQETGPEGHVYNYKGKSVKIVRRRPEEGSSGVAFSQANLQKGGVGK